MVALDAQTGKTLWQTTHADAVIQAAGKRGGFQVTPAFAHGRIYSLGSAGLVRAHDAATGTLAWEVEVGPRAGNMRKKREEMLAKARTGVARLVEADGLATSLVVAGAIVVVPTGDEGLAGFDCATGAKLWAMPQLITENATPTVWRHQDRDYVLTGHSTGVLTLIDALAGRKVWQRSGYGPTYTTLSMADDIVVMNVKPQPPPKEKVKGVRYPGLFGGVRITLDGPQELWRLPDEPANSTPVWMDSAALQRVLIQDGHAYIPTEYHSLDPTDRKQASRYHLVELATGRSLACHHTDGQRKSVIGGLIYPYGDKLICRADPNHGALHGGRHPFVLWNQGPQGFTRCDDLGQPLNLDLADQISAYTTLMETPIVDGRLFERTTEGRVVCYDLRAKPLDATWELAFSPAALGLSSFDMPVRLWEQKGGRIRHGRCLPPTGEQVGAITGTYRTFSRWEGLPDLDLRYADGAISGPLLLDRGNIRIAVRLDLQTTSDGAVNGTWRRSVPAQPEVTTTGHLSGPARSPQRLFPTPWDKANPFPSFGQHPAGTTTTVVVLPGGIPGDKPRDLALCLDHDGTRFIRALGTAFRYGQSWQEVDASGLSWKGDALTGTAMIILNRDTFQTRIADPGWAGRLTMAAEVVNGQLTGTWSITWGLAHDYQGTVKGRRR